VIGPAISADLKRMVWTASLGVRKRSSAAIYGRDMVLYRTRTGWARGTAAGCYESLYCITHVTVSYYKVMLVGTHPRAAVGLVGAA
jgi:hypothetical protein